MHIEMKQKRVAGILSFFIMVAAWGSSSGCLQNGYTRKPAALPRIKMVFCLGRLREWIIAGPERQMLKKELNGYHLRIYSAADETEIIAEENGWWTAPTIEADVPKMDSGYRILLELGKRYGDRPEKGLKQVYLTNEGHGPLTILQNSDVNTSLDMDEPALSFCINLAPSGAGLSSLANQPRKTKEIDLYIRKDRFDMYPVDMGNPSSSDFFTLSDGTDMKQFDLDYEEDWAVVKEKENLGIAGELAPLLETKTGLGYEFSGLHEKKYRLLKKNPGISWVVRELDAGEIIAQSPNAGENIFAASLPKIIIAAAALQKKNGRPDTHLAWRDLMILIIKSWNSPWWERTLAMAGNNRDLEEFTNGLGITGIDIGLKRKNELNALAMSRFYYQLLQKKFSGAQIIYKMAYACETGPDKARKYMPSDIYMGGKTGYRKEFDHDSRFFKYRNRWYTIVVLTKGRSHEDVAIMFGGLFREYIAAKKE